MSKEQELGSGVPQVDTVQNIKNAVKNTVDFSLRLPVASRVKKRLAELTKLSSAVSVVIPQGNTKQPITNPPDMHIAALKGTIINGEGVISYSVYQTDDQGNKLLTNHMADVADGVDEKGSTKYKKVVSSASYDIEYEIIERIAKGKPMKTEKVE